MSIRGNLAISAGRLARWGGQVAFGRSAGNLPGVIALKIDPLVLCQLAKKVDPIAVVSGTNGKTTTNNLVADCLAASGKPLYCNREGNNLQAGVVTSLLVPPVVTSPTGPLAAAPASPEASSEVSPQASPDAPGTDASTATPIGSFECDELYTRYVLPRLKPRFFMLLNLFRDQLDRFGEIDHTQDVIVEALTSSPQTTFVYNGDDPICAGIAQRIPNKTVAFGISTPLGLEADRISDSRFCQSCGAELAYEYVHYSQLGAYSCPACGWKRPELQFAAHDVRHEAEGFSFQIDGQTIQTYHHGVYMVYNVLAAYAISQLSGEVNVAQIQDAVRNYRPTNGRLQTFEVGERQVMTNLAKNPVGFNQNIRIVLNEQGRVFALFVNDNDPDGHDVSWFWDIDFENWADIQGLKAFVGGSRANDMQVRLKYAGIPAQLVDSVADVLAATGTQDGKVYVIANYTALPQVRAELNKLVVEAPAPVPAVAPVPAQAPAPVPAPATASTSAAEKEARS